MFLTVCRLDCSLDVQRTLRWQNLQNATANLYTSIDKSGIVRCDDAAEHAHTLSQRKSGSQLLHCWRVAQHCFYRIMRPCSAHGSASVCIEVCCLVQSCTLQFVACTESFLGTRVWRRAHTFAVYCRMSALHMLLASLLHTISREHADVHPIVLCTRSGTTFGRWSANLF